MPYLFALLAVPLMPLAVLAADRWWAGLLEPGEGPYAALIIAAAVACTELSLWLA